MAKELTSVQPMSGDLLKPFVEFFKKHPNGIIYICVGNHGKKKEEKNPYGTYSHKNKFG